jgi:polysaccharide export outer membrane protein
MKALVSITFLCLILTISSMAAFAAEKPYHIGPGDVLEISVWKDPELNKQLVVPPDGNISFPLIGSINVTHLAVPDLKKAVAQKLSEFIPDATVTVMLIEINNLKAYVIGKVNNPGEFPIDMETNVMQILSKAGGLNPFASRGSIKILRQESNKIIKIPFDYGQVEKGKNLEQNIILRTGDVIVVP